MEVAEARGSAETTARSVIRFEGVRKVYREEHGEPVPALDTINLELPGDHCFISLIGPSGCGKSTLLKLLAGIERPSEGLVTCRGLEVRGINTQISYVPQGKGLFPWMTLRDNIELPLKIAGIGAAERARRADEWIGLVELTGFENSFPRQLSGGMEKRGSLARALIADRPVSLMDEPFGPLDAQTRLTLQQHLLKLWEKLRNTVVFVTHDLVEAIALSDLIVVFSPRPGRILEVVKVPLPRPRDVLTVYDYEGFNALYKPLQKMLLRERS